MEDPAGLGGGAAQADSSPARARQGRTAFSFSRDLEFASEPELAKRMGCPRALWLRAAVKEVIDNSLDAAEETGIDPDVAVEVDGSVVTVTDNGPGMLPDLVERLCVRFERTSTREAYAAPDRGAQGNALQVLMALSLGFGRDQAVTVITSRGVEHTITLRVNRLEQRI
jgi:DNA topoisomerase VI subunit B